MVISRRYSLARGLLYTWWIILLAALWSSAICAAHEYLSAGWLVLPALPVTVLGTGVSFYLSFKGNAAYGRLWEARKIWGGIVNDSRSWAALVNGFVTTDHVDASEDTLVPLKRELVHRHAAWLAALRIQLRRRKNWEHDSASNNKIRKMIGTDDQSPERMAKRMAPFLEEDELARVMGLKNQATQLLARQAERLRDLKQQGYLEDFRHIELAQLVQNFYTLQGKCERIKNFPLPRQYATMAFWVLMAFLVLLPFALVSQFVTLVDHPHAIWFSVPCSVLVTWIYAMWDLVVDFTENPFEGLANDIPMDELSRTIEIDMFQIIGESDIPGPIERRVANIAL